MATYAYLQDHWGELRTNKTHTWQTAIFGFKETDESNSCEQEKNGGEGGRTVKKKKKKTKKTEILNHTEAVKLLSEYTADKNTTWALYIAQEPCQLIVR